MKGHHGPAGAVVVVDQVVDAQDVVVAQHDAVDVRRQLRVHGPPQQGVQGVPGGLPPCLQDEGGHQQSGQSVHLKPPEVVDQGGEKDYAGGQAVGQGVRGGGLHGGGADGPPQAAVEPEHPEFYQDGRR